MKVEKYVLKALENNPKARQDDFILYLEVSTNFVDSSVSFGSVLKNHEAFGLPSFESVTRCRRKLQERDITLRDERTYIGRQNEQEKYKDYALNDKVGW